MESFTRLSATVTPKSVVTLTLSSHFVLIAPILYFVTTRQPV